MRKLLCIFLLLQCLWATGQPLRNSSPADAKEKKGNTYAVVIGISKYENLKPEDQLDFADRDADVFANYLQSKAGGSVPADNIQLLKNEEANYFAITKAIRWLVENCKKDDVAYFYFSGHGTLEDFFESDDAYLLAYNSLSNNFAYNAVRIGYLNDMAKTLAKKNNGKVIVITDACHSGKLAGKEKNMMRAASLLRETKGRDIRITSCAANELSNEDVRWGGGRSVFSYYLVNGLKKDADLDGNGRITIGEIRSYLKTAFKADPILAEAETKNGSQTPVINAVNDSFQLAAVNKQALAEEALAAPAPVLLKAISKPALNYFFDVLKVAKPGQLFHFTDLVNVSKEQMPWACLKMMYDSLSDYNSAISVIHANDFISPNDFMGYTDKSVADNPTYKTAKDAFLNKYEAIRDVISSNPDAVKIFEEKLVEIFINEVQTAINNYISGDECEMEKRMYYNRDNNGYDAYPLMLQTALRYIQPGSQLYNEQLLKMYYFKGVALRLKLGASDDPAAMIAEAIALQKKAIALENPNEPAAYIRNELGVLYAIKKDNKKANSYFNKANQVAPSWPIPLANLIYQYTLEKNWKKANAAARIADSLKSDFLLTRVNIGSLYEASGNYLLAMEKFYKAAQQNPRYYLSYERLGFLYLNTLRYEYSDSMFNEAFRMRKNTGYIFDNPRHMKSPNVGRPDFWEQKFPCSNLTEAEYYKNGVLGQFAKAINFYIERDSTKAEKEFRKLISMDEYHPLGYHYLGKILAGQQRWAEAEIMLQKAELNWADSIEYFDADINTRLRDESPENCIRYVSDYFQYEKTDNYYILGDVYEAWQHYEQAEDEYQKIINADKEFIGGYYKMWNLMERLRRYNDAEDIIKRYAVYDDKKGNCELYEFYKRMLKRLPNSTEWLYKAANLLYYLKLDSKAYVQEDAITINPFTLEEEFDPNNRPFSEINGSFNLPGLTREKEKKDYYYQPEINVNGVTGPPPPGTIEYAPKISMPTEQAIGYFILADSLLATADYEIAADASAADLYDDMGLRLADINNKIADLYDWQGLPGKALKYFKKSLTHNPGNANTRLKYIDALVRFSEYIEMQAQMDTLYQRSQIDYNKLLMLTEGEIMSGRYKKAADLLKAITKMSPLKTDDITYLNGMLQMLSDHPKEAIPFYQALLNNFPANSSYTYSIARAYALLGNKKEAWNWLKKSLDKGFNYGNVLYYEPVWEKFRKSPEWDLLLENYSFKVYPGE